MKNEIDSKRILLDYGIVTTEPRLARTVTEAERMARALGGRLALKVVSPDIVHKAAVGGVRLNVSSADVPAVFQSIMAAVRAARPDAQLNGVLLEPMIEGALEVFVGARMDPQYNGVVLFGLGGSRVEHGQRPAIALVPIDEGEADWLIEQGLGDFIGSLGLEVRRRLRHFLMAVAGPKGLLLQARVAEIDINPIIVSDEQAVAVDAVIIETPIHVGREIFDERAVADAALHRRLRLSGLDALFEPRSIAVIGASTNRSKLGYRIIRNLLDFGFRGQIYPIHPSANQICGLSAYRSVDVIAAPVDRAYIAVAARQVPEVLEACARKGVKLAQVLTAGFSEWSSAESSGQPQELESQVRKVLANAQMRMVGPNCLGTFSASARIPLAAPQYCPTGPGGITFISQSGTFAGDVVRRAQVLGLPVGKVLSCGNCTDLDLIDYLLFCADDVGTELIAFYIESLSNPGLFFRLAAGIRKPIIILKGGTSDQGVAAASSHTAALSTDQALWRAATAQAGILQVDGVESLLDVLLAFAAHHRLPGNRLAIFGSGGGVSVTSTDIAAANGMSVPALAESSCAALARFGVPGTSVNNPIDIPVWGLREGERYILEEIINFLKDDPGVDSIIVYVEMGSIMDFADSEADGRRQLVEVCESIARARRGGPRVSIALRSSGDKLQDDFVREQRLRLLKEEIAIFTSTARVVRAHASLWRLTREKVDMARQAAE